MKSICIAFFCLVSTLCFAQKENNGSVKADKEICQKTITQKLPLISMDRVESNGLTVSKVNYKGFECLEAFYDKPEPDEKFITIQDLEFGDGTIEIELSGTPGEYAGKFAKGFVGLVFHVQNDTTYECIYLRPVNGMDNNQLFRNRTVQYTSHPDFPWQRLRKESPGTYETYSEVKPDEWINYKLEVEGDTAKLFINDAKEPSFIVNDLKLGGIKGGIGLWVGSYTLARFRNLKVTNIN